MSVIRRRQRQMALAQLVLFGVVTSPEELMNPILRRMDECTLGGDREQFGRGSQQALAQPRHLRATSGPRGRDGFTAISSGGHLGCASA